MQLSSILLFVLALLRVNCGSSFCALLMSSRSGRIRQFDPNQQGRRGRYVAPEPEEKKRCASPVATRKQKEAKRTKLPPPPPPAPPCTPDINELLVGKLGPTSSRSPRCLDYGVNREVLHPGSEFCMECTTLEDSITSGTASRLNVFSRRFMCQHLGKHTSFAFPFPFSARERPQVLDEHVSLKAAASRPLFHQKTTSFEDDNLSYTDSETANETDDYDSDEEIDESMPVRVDCGANTDHHHPCFSDNPIITLEKEDKE
jgi:hypothetical protein